MSSRMKALVEGFFDDFGQLDDPRMEKNKLYPMGELLFTSLCAVICGAEGWEDVEAYGKSKIAYLREYLPYANGMPSDDTYRRFFRSLDRTALSGVFSKWMSRIVKGQIKHIAIDGKTNRHTFDGDKDPLHLISAFSSESRLVLAQCGQQNKGHEIAGIKEVLGLLDISGSLVSIDAMGTQKSIAKKIIEKDGDYLLALKGNQVTLHDDVKEYFATDELKADFFETVEKGHGRLEKRGCRVVSEIDYLQENHHWEGLSSIVEISSEREYKGQVAKEKRYYISSAVKSAKEMLEAVRSHWSIENSLHWVLDMSFNEDQSRIRKENAPQNMAVIRHAALNMINQARGKREYVPKMRKKAGWDNSVLDRVLGTL